MFFSFFQLGGVQDAKKSMPMTLLTGRVLGVTDISDRGVNDVTVSNLVGQSHKAKGALFIYQWQDFGKKPTSIFHDTTLPYPPSLSKFIDLALKPH